MPGATAPTSATRRTQAERRNATRRALLDATVDALIEQGWAGATTPEVCRRAGVSQGAVFKHFPTKADLLAAAAAHLYDDLLAAWLERFRPLATETDDEARVRAAVALLWALFDSPSMGAALELAAAARTDPELRARLEPVVLRHAERMRAVAAGLFPDAAGSPDAALALDLILESMLGMAVSRTVDRTTEHYDRLLAHLTDLAVHTFAATDPMEQAR